MRKQSAPDNTNGISISCPLYEVLLVYSVDSKLLVQMALLPDPVTVDGLLIPL